MADISSTALLIDIEPLADEVGSRSRVYELIGKGELQAVKLGTSTKVLGESWRDFVKRLPPAQIKAPRSRSQKRDLTQSDAA